MAILNSIIICGLIFVILTVPSNFSQVNFSLGQKGNFQFGNQGMENAGGVGQAGQGNAGGVGQAGQGNAKSMGGIGCPTGPKGADSMSCSTNPTTSPTHIDGSSDTTNNVVVSGSSSSTGSSSLAGKIYIIHGPTDKTGGNPYSSTAACHSNDSILGGGSVYDITDGNVISFSAIPDSLSTFTTTITSSSNSDSALTVQAYAICYDNP